jgi:hypothetical protein
MKRRVIGFCFIVVAFCIYYGLLYFLVCIFDPAIEQYALARKLNALGIQLRAYKTEHGIYPKDISMIIPSKNICFYEVYTRCKKIHYKPNFDLSDFKMALDPSFGLITFYDPNITLDDEIQKTISAEERKKRLDSGILCGYCFATPKRVLFRSSSPYPIYRINPLYFPNPEEWPIIR